MEQNKENLTEARLEGAMRTPYVFNNILNAAIKLDIFKNLNDQALTIGQLSKKICVDQEVLQRLINVLTGTGFLDKENDFYKSSATGKEAELIEIEANPQSAGPLNALWPHLAEAIKEGGPQWYRVLGGEPGEGDIFSKFYEEDPENLKKFCEFMNMSSTPAGEEIANSYDFSHHQAILDIAGGMGGLSVAIGKKFSHLKGMVMELPKVSILAEEYFKQQGVDERFKAVSGDLFAGPYPTGADVAVLSWILHDWNDTSASTILKHAFTALPSSGILMLSECILDENGLGKVGHRIQAEILSLMMLLSQEKGARERTFTEFKNLLEQVGFVDVALQTMAGPRDLIIAQKP